MTTLTAVKADILSDIPQLEWMIRDKLPKMSVFSFAMGHMANLQEIIQIFFATPP